MPKCHFYLQITAPAGLEGIHEHLEYSKMNLVPKESGYNGKIILRRSPSETRFDWQMDSSDTDTMVANGVFFLPVDEAKLLLKSLSDMLISAGYPHQIFIDDEKGANTFSFRYLMIG
jgi:hypothetical protein